MEQFKSSSFFAKIEQQKKAHDAEVKQFMQRLQMDGCLSDILAKYSVNHATFWKNLQLAVNKWYGSYCGVAGDSREKQLACEILETKKIYQPLSIVVFADNSEIFAQILKEQSVNLNYWLAIACLFGAQSVVNYILENFDKVQFSPCNLIQYAIASGSRVFAVELTSQFIKKKLDLPEPWSLNAFRHYDIWEKVKLLIEASECNIFDYSWFVKEKKSHNFDEVDLNSLNQIFGQKSPRFKIDDVAELIALYDIYHKVKSSCKVGYLYRKKSRVVLHNRIQQILLTSLRKDFIPPSIIANIGIGFDQKLVTIITTELLQLFTAHNEIAVQRDAIVNGLSILLASEISFLGKVHSRCVNKMGEDNPMNDGRVYEPLRTHNIYRDIVWVLAHIHKGNKFLLYDAVTPENMLRQTEGHKNELSSFAWEASFAIKAGYILEKQQGSKNILAKPSKSVEYLRTLRLQDIALSLSEAVDCYIKVGVALYPEIKKDVWDKTKVLVVKAERALFKKRSRENDHVIEGTRKLRR